MNPKNENYEDLLELTRVWKNKAAAWLHLANTWHGIILPLKMGQIPFQASFLSVMQEQARALEEKLQSDEGNFATPPERPAEKRYSEAELAEIIRQKLNERKSRPQDLAESIGVAKDLVEKVLEGYTMLFSRAGDRGWWEAKK